MITELLAALSAIPKIASSLDQLAGTHQRPCRQGARSKSANTKGQGC